jgi:hypothetical protein
MYKKLVIGDTRSTSNLKANLDHKQLSKTYSKASLYGNHTKSNLLESSYPNPFKDPRDSRGNYD